VYGFGIISVGGQVFQFDNRIPDFDPSQGLRFIGSHFVTDGTRAYSLLGRRMIDANPATLEVINDAYARDDQSYFCNGNRLADDVNTPIDMERGPTIVTIESVYWGCQEISGVVPSDPLETLGWTYLVVGRRVFHNGAELVGADGLTFEAAGPFARDSSQCYENDRVIECGRGSCTISGFGRACNPF
ncbi:MAG: hypothetical protein AAF203_09440, partial [Pseudomonadota bacterium]